MTTTTIQFPELPTQDQIRNLELDVYATIKILEGYHVYATRPRKPRHELFASTPQGYRELTDAMEQYEIDLEQYKLHEKECRDHNLIVGALINWFISEESGLNTIPEKYRNKVFSNAWNIAHADGYYEIYNHLCQFVEIFK